MIRPYSSAGARERLRTEPEVHRHVVVELYEVGHRLWWVHRIIIAPPADPRARGSIAWIIEGRQGWIRQLGGVGSLATGARVEQLTSRACFRAGKRRLSCAYEDEC